MNVADISNWYWKIGADEANVWSSKQAKAVAVADAEYVAWHEAPFQDATPIATKEELLQVFTAQYPPGALETYCVYVRDKTVNGGINVNGRPFATDPLTLMSLNSAYIYTQGNTGATFSWKLPDGTFVTLGKQDVAQLQAAVSEHGQLCFECEADTMDAIAAGTITTRQQIDAAFAAVNNSFSGLVLQARKSKR